MRNLLPVVAALLVARLQIATAAPQPLDLSRTTIVADSPSDNVRTSDSVSTEGMKFTTTFMNVNLETSSKPTSLDTPKTLNSNVTESLKDSDPDSSTIVESRFASDLEKSAEEFTTLTEGIGRTRASVDFSRDDSSTDPIVKETTIGGNDNTKEHFTATTKESPIISVVRYVPPLDPMKHMLMMAEAKKQLEIENTAPTSEITTTLAPEITKAMLVERYPVNDSATEVLDKNNTGDRESEKVEIFTAASIRANEVDHKHSNDSETENFNSSRKPEEISTSVPSTERESELTSTEESIKISLDINPESSILVKSSELFSGKEDVLNAEISKELLKSADTETSYDELDASNSNSHSDTSTMNISEFPSTHLHVTTESIEREDITNSTSLEKNNDEIDVRDILDTDGDSAMTTEKNYPQTEKKTSEESPSTPSVLTSSLSTILDLIATTDSLSDSTTENENLEKLASHSESVKNMSFEEDIEFREDLANFNTSDVIYEDENGLSTNETIFLMGIENGIFDKPITGTVEEETTTEIITTKKEQIFSTTASSTSLIHKIGNELTTELTTENNKDELLSEFTTNISSSEVMKVELLKSDINNISSSGLDISTTTISEQDSETKLVDNERNQSLTTTIESSSEDFKSSENNQESTIPEATASSETATAEDSRLNLEITTSSKPEYVDALYINAPASIYSDNDGIPTLNDMNTKDRYISGNNTDTVAAVQFLHHHDKSSSEQCFKLVNAHWNYATNLTEENKKKQLEQTLEYALFHKEAWRNATSFAWKSFNDTLLRRWFKSLSVLGTAALPEDKLNEFNRLKAEMKNIYSTAKVCEYDTRPSSRSRSLQKSNDCKLSLEPDLQRILTRSRDYDELTYVWKAWRDAAGKPLREKYLRFVELSNEAARLNGFSDTGDMWREAYESDTFEADLEELWNQLKPLYENLHAYVRRRLIGEYGSDKIREDGPIPAHLFGNMWAQSWVSLLDITQPFPGKPSVDVTPIMEAKNLSALEMFQISEEFFTSLGLKPMPEEFWKHSLIEKPKDREIICHASAWDFCNGKDYRIKQCTDITMEDLITVHHEMGHIQYFLQYARQPNVFREGANPGFHEAIGDVLALSVSTPRHLQSIGLLEEVSDDPEGDLNFLLRTALDKVSFLPSGYLIDQWRWGLFSGEIQPHEMNKKWWDLRLKYQGICPPVKRQDTDFDPGAKYHVPGNVPYIRYFVSFVIQFQFHKVLCDAAGHTGPLYKCDIYRSKEAGQILSQVMELGSSEHWSEAMKIMTGGDTNRMDAGPILEYFQPLLAFLEEQNKNETLGWISSDSTICP